MTDLIPASDLVVEVARARPPGGQQVGVSNGVRVTHVPTGIIVECQCERSQHRNRQVCLDALEGALTGGHIT